MSEFSQALQIDLDTVRSFVLDAAQDSLLSLSNPGLCVACGEEVDGVEPDAECYECENCGEHAVFGAEQLLIYTA